MCNEIENTTCDICGKYKQVSRKYYHYDINCKCCGNNHFEIVKYCKNCKPKPPHRINVIMIPIEEDSYDII